MINKPKWLLQFFSNKKAPMEVSERFLSEKYLEDDNGLPVVSLKDLDPNRTIRIWAIQYNKERDRLEYIAYNREISFSND
jgi:hypothetical protein